MRKLILFAFATMLSVFAYATDENSKYLAGAVPTSPEGYVVFQKSYDIPGASAEQLYNTLLTYVTNEIVEGPNHLVQCRITQATTEDYTIAAAVEENLYFVRRAMRSDFTRFFYQLVAQAENGRINIVIRNIHYLYDNTERENEYADFRAETWITDKYALNRKGQLAKVSGKFRKATIDRVDEICRSAAKACGVKPKVRIVEEYD